MSIKDILNPHCIAVIPARYASTRFHAKMLATVAGKTLIQHTYENALKCPLLSDVFVATDSHEIYDHVKSFGGKAAMTSIECENGTQRLAEFYKNTYVNQNKSCDIIVNIQGDEPLVAPSAIEAIIRLLIDDSSSVMGTAVTPLFSYEEANKSSIVKCIFDQKGYALYFSRALIPGQKEVFNLKRTTYYKHLGIYSYRPEFLLNYSTLASTPLQQIEDLEQLKVLEHGFRIKTAIVSEEGVGVDTPEDLNTLEKLLCKQNTSLLQEGSAPP